jgi:hypothetical protein
MKYSNISSSFSLATAARVLCLLCLLITLSLLPTSSARAQTEPPTTDPQDTTTTTTTNAIAHANRQAVKAQSVVRGRAVYDDTDRPVRRARVVLLESSGGRTPERSGMTNASGEFRIKNVPAGSYFVMIDAPGVITPISFIDIEEVESERINFDEIRKNFTEITVDGTNEQTIKVRARKGGAINGKVTYADGDPAINVRVNVMRKKDGRAARFITNINPTTFFGIQTDDRGMYRLSSLPPGEYIVSVIETADHTDGRGEREEYWGSMSWFGANSLLVTYYPSAINPGEAATVQVDAGQEQNEINISLVERTLHKISGTLVTRRDNKPLPSVRIGIKNKTDRNKNDLGGYMAQGNSQMTDEQGRFSFSEIPDGPYTLTVDAAQIGEDPVEPEEGEEEAEPATPPQPVEPKRRFPRKQQDVTINGNDVADLIVAMSEGASVSGIVTFEGDRGSRTSFYITLEDTTGSEIPSGERQYLQEDGRFTLDGLNAGGFYPKIIVSDENSEKYYVKSMTAGGADLMRDLLVIGEGTVIRDVRVLVASDGATLAGRILTQNNMPVTGARLVLIPANQTKWRARPAYLFGASAANGDYSISGAPGEYLIIFMRAGDHPTAVNENWIRERAADAQRIMLQPNQRKSLNLIAPTQ